MAGDRGAIHAGSPYGGGHEAPVAIEHWKFIVRTLAERRAIIERYDRVQEGAGSRFRAFSCPEDFYGPEVIASSTMSWDGRDLTPVQSAAVPA